MTRENSSRGKSFVQYDENSHFPIENLPYGVFRTKANSLGRVGIAIGEEVLDLSVLEEEGLFTDILPSGRSFFNKSSLNDFMKTGKGVWQRLRKSIGSLLSINEPELRDNDRLRGKAFVHQQNVIMLLPAEISNYTDFYSSMNHAKNVGTMIRGSENALQSNWLHLPVGYHGRASSIVVTGTNFPHPFGQIRPKEDQPPIYGQSGEM
ncbi:MAG TPA: hypothetical protein VJ044_17100, partial [Candidatus Hodarchaeales archaeon]|nr:hypothetical protein [Candidatus Hodarchaeales archaeon]